MAGSLAIYACKKLLDHLFNNAAWSAPSVRVALSTADPGEDGAGLAEPVGNNYARVTTTNADWGDASTADPSVLANSVAITFPVPSGSWGLCTHFALMDGAGANVIASGTLTVSKTPASGDTVEFAIGALTISLD
jgi:hypothetical protein